MNKEKENIKYHVYIEFRYDKAREEDSTLYFTKKVTIGIFDTLEEAQQAGNEQFPILEEKFPLNPHYNIKRRFNNQLICGSRNTLISNSDYIYTPFYFCAHIEKLIIGNISVLLDTYNKDMRK